MPLAGKLTVYKLVEMLVVPRTNPNPIAVTQHTVSINKKWKKGKNE
jgi:hypothetical protein